MGRAVLSIIVMLLAAHAAWGDPVPDKVVHEFWDLIVATAEADRCPDPERLAEDFGCYGLDLLEDSHLKAIRKKFDVFAPILAESQRPPYGPKLSVQRLYRELADKEQRDHMVQSLREWLTAEITEAPRSGSMLITGPPSMVETAIGRGRGVAAEMLADWKDDSAGPLIAALESRDGLDYEALWRLGRARSRLADSCAVTFLRITPGGDLECCAALSEVREVTVGRGGLRSNAERYPISQAEIDELWGEILDSRLDKNSNWASGGYTVILEFEHGVRAELSPTERGRMVYYDNTMIESRQRFTLKNKDLYDLIRDLFEREMGVEAR